MYTLLELESKTFGELKKIGYELNVLPAGDRRCRQSWIDALVNINPPLLQLLKVSPAASVVEPVQEAIENPPGVEVDSAQEPIALAAKTSPAASVNPVSEAIVLAVENSTSVEVEPVQKEIKLGDWVKVTRKPRLASGVKRGEIFQVLRVNCNGVLVIENPHKNPKYILSARLGFLDPSEVCLVPRSGRSDTPAFIDVVCRNFPECIQELLQNPSGVGRVQKLIEVQPTEPRAEVAKASPAASVDPVSEPIEVQSQEAPLESNFGSIVYPQPAQKAIAQEAETSPAVSFEQVQEAITQAAENSPGVESVEPTQKAQEHKFLLCLKDGDNTLWYDGKDFVLEKWSAKTYCKRGVGAAKHQLRSHPEVKRVGNVLQVVENFPRVEPIEVQRQEPSALAAKTPPGVEEVDQRQELIARAAKKPGAKVAAPCQKAAAELLQQKNLAELEEIAWCANVLPQGDPQCRQSWIDPLVAKNINPFALQYLCRRYVITQEAPAGEVQRQEPIEQAAEASPAASVEQVQEAIAQEAETSPAVSFEQVQEAIEQATENTTGVEVEPVQKPIMETGETSPVENEQAQEWVDPDPPCRED